MALRNYVQPKKAGEKGERKVCMREMTAMMECLEKYDQNQGMCEKEIKRYNTCGRHG